MAAGPAKSALGVRWRKLESWGKSSRKTRSRALSAVSAVWTSHSWQKSMRKHVCSGPRTTSLENSLSLEDFISEADIASQDAVTCLVAFWLLWLTVWARNLKEQRPKRCWVRNHGFQEPWPPLLRPYPSWPLTSSSPSRHLPPRQASKNQKTKHPEEPWTQLYYFSSFISLSWNWNQWNRTSNVRLLIFCFKNWQIPLWVLAPLCFHFTTEKVRLGGKKTKRLFMGSHSLPTPPSPHQVNWACPWSHASASSF